MARKRRRRSGGIPFGSSTGGLLIAAAGVLLVVMSGPRLIGAVNATAGEPAIEKLKRGEEIGPPAIDRARKAFATAARSIPRDYRAYRDLALIEMVAARMPQGVPQADGSMAPEPVMDVQHVADAVLHMANLPLDANVLFMTVMATNMPFVGRG